MAEFCDACREVIPLAGKMNRAAMFANVTTFHRRPERLDDVGLDDITAILREREGYRGAYVLVNRETGTQLTITLWDTGEAMDGAIAILKPLREQRARELDDTQPPSRDRFEVVAYDRTE